MAVSTATRPGRRTQPTRSQLRLRHWRLLLRLSAIAVTTVAAWEFLLAPLLGHFSGDSQDFAYYLGAARGMAAGHSPYATFTANSSVVMGGFDYPPFAALLVRPLAFLDDRAALTLWLWLSVACTLSATLLLARTALPRGWPRTEIALLAAFAFAPAADNYWHGQMNPFVFLLLALAFRSWVRGRESSTGVLLGLAAAIKLSPIVLVVLLLRRRWWRGSAVMLATAAGSLLVTLPLVGTTAVRSFLTDVLPALTRETGWIANQSLGGVLSRLADHSVLSIGPTSLLLHVAVLATAAALLLLAVQRVRAAPRSDGERAVEFGLGVTAMLLASSIAWYHHFTHLLIPLAAAAGLLAERTRTRTRTSDRRLAATAVAALLAFGLLTPLVLGAISLHTLSGLQGSPAWWPTLQLFSLPALAALAFFAAQRHALREDAIA